jgi:TPP-dependent pyruvate/acetoin dehydrogenase alpha subunit
MKPLEKIEMYKKMLKIRFFEEESVVEIRSGMPGFIHSYAGQEAVAVGACSAIRKDDYITSTHRGHGHCIAKGADLKMMMAELWGKVTGYNKGKGGSMHIASYELGILGANGIVGGGIPIATGAGLSIKVDKLDKVVLCFFGDAAANQGTFHESINIASAFKLPVIYICENNLYGVGTYQPRVRAIEDIADRAAGYGIPGVIADGNDIMAVYNATSEAVKRARKCDGPTLLEFKTYRWYPHFEGDIDPRPPEEVASWKEKEPINRFREVLFSENILDKVKDKEIINTIKEEVSGAVKFAHESPEPELSEALTDVYK